MAAASPACKAACRLFRSLLCLLALAVQLCCAIFIHCVIVLHLLVWCDLFVPLTSAGLVRLCALLAAESWSVDSKLAGYALAT